MPEWWDALTTAEKFASTGGLVGFASVIVTILIAWDSRRTARKQLDIAAEANATTRLSVEDQLHASKAARSATVRLAKVIGRNRIAAELAGDIDAITNAYPAVEFPPDKQMAVLVLTFINDGMAPAYNVRISPTAIQDVALIRHHRGYHLNSPDLPFVSFPEADFLSIPPGHTTDFPFAVRISQNDVVLRAEYKIAYEDGLGLHEAKFGFGTEGAGIATEVRGWIFDVDPSADENRRHVVT